MAPLTEDDRTLIRILRIEKHLNAYQMINEFPARNWSENNLNRLIRQILKGRNTLLKASWFQWLQWRRPGAEFGGTDKLFADQDF